MKARKKPVVIDYFPVSRALNLAQHAWNELPDWIREAYHDGKFFFGNSVIHITTLEGTMTGGSEDVIIRGVQGELYPCKADIFAATYDPILEGEEQ